MMKKYLLSALLLVSACGPATPPATPPVVAIYATSATLPWLAKTYACGDTQPAVIRLSDHPADADIRLRLGEPNPLSMPAFQIDSEDVLVVVNPARSISNLDAAQVAALFTGQISDWNKIDPSHPGNVQVWVFAQGEDIQQVFEKTLSGSPIVSTARLATSPDDMSTAVANDVNSIGILPRHSLGQNLSSVHVAATAPVLALTASEPQGAIQSLLACLQK